MIRLYRADLFPDLEAALVHEVHTARAEDPLAAVRIVVPTSIARSHIRRLLAQKLGGGHLDLRVETLAGIARRLGVPVLGALGKSVAPHAAIALAAAAAARETRLETLAPIASCRGFGPTVAATLRDLSDAGLQPQDLRALALRSDSADRLLDLADLWMRVRAAIDRAGWVEEAALFSAAASAASAERVPTVLHGIYDATHAQRTLLEALIRDVEAAATVPVGPVFADPYVAWLVSLGARPTEPPPADPISAALAAARASLFGSPDRAAAGAVEIRSCPSPLSEGREAVRALTQAVRSGGTRLDEVVLLVRADDRTAPPFGEVLEEAGIPADVGIGRRAALPRDAALVLSLVEARRSRVGRHAWMDVLAAPDVRLESLAPAFERSARSPASWDRAARELALHGDVPTMRRRLDGRVAAIAADPDRDPGIREWAALPLRAFSTALGALHDALGAVPEHGLPGEVTSALGGVAERLLGRELDPLVRTALTEIASLDALGREVDLADVAALFAETVERPPAASGEGGAVVADLLSARGATFKTAILTGLCERAFPRVSNGDPLLGDEDRSALREATGRPLADKVASAEAEERFLLRLVLGSVSERLVATFHRRDADGRERAPSVFVYALADAAEGRTVFADELHDLSCVRRVAAGRFFPPSADDCIDERERMLHLVHGALGSGDADALAAAIRHRPFARAALQAEEGRWRTTALGPWDGRVSGARILETGILDRALSASRIEGFVRCPFRWFLLDVVRVAPEDERTPSLGLDPLQRGSAVHEALRSVVGARIGKTGDHGTLRDDALRAMRAQVAALAAQGALAHPATAESEAQVLAERIAETAALVLADAIAPVAVEKEFADLPVTVQGRTIRLRGRIDRIDVTGARGRVVDYKTGSTTKASRTVACLVQLPIYVHAAAAIHPEVTEWSAKLERVAIDGEKPKDEVDRQTADADLARVMEAIVASAQSGEVPQNALECRYCAVRAACEPKAAIARLARRKANDPARVRLDALRLPAEDEE